MTTAPTTARYSAMNERAGGRLRYRASYTTLRDTTVVDNFFISDWDRGTSGTLAYETGLRGPVYRAERALVKLPKAAKMSS